MTSTEHRRPVVVITGASSGIGRATAVRLLRTGDYRLALVARRGEALDETVQLAGGAADAQCFPCDLGDSAAVRQLVTELHRNYADGIDALVNNAGAGTSVPFGDASTLDEVDRMLTLNLRAPIALTHALLPQLTLVGGTVVNVSSVAGLVGTPDSPVYSATKWGLTGFTEAIRAHVQRRGVRVVNVQPGPVPTPGWDHTDLARSFWGRVFASNVDTIAQVIHRAIDRRGPVSVVRPRVYAVIPTIRGIAPWLVRWGCGVAARSGTRTASTRRQGGT